MQNNAHTPPPTPAPTPVPAGERIAQRRAAINRLERAIRRKMSIYPRHSREVTAGHHALDQLNAYRRALAWVIRP